MNKLLTKTDVCRLPKKVNSLAQHDLFLLIIKTQNKYKNLIKNFAKASDREIVMWYNISTVKERTEQNKF